MSSGIFWWVAGTAVMIAGVLSNRHLREFLARSFATRAYSQQRDLAIDGIRGIVSTSVVFGHYFQYLSGPEALKVVDGAIFPYAVSLFAAMSGYVLYAGLSAKPLTADVISSYLKRRFFRIYPLYVLYFVIMFITVVGVSATLMPRQILTLLSDLLMMDLWRFGWRLRTPTWSLYPEMMYSLMLPLWMLLLAKHPRGGGRGAMVTYFVLAVFSWAATPNGATDATFNLLRYFFLGMALFHGVKALRQYGVTVWMEVLLSVGFILGCYLSLAFTDWASMPTALAVPLNLYKRIGISFHQDLCILLFTPAILLCGWLRRLFSLPAVVFLGTISYGTYILHIPLFYLLHADKLDSSTGMFVATGPNLPWGEWNIIVYWLGVILLASIAHVVIEQPMINFGYRLSRPERG